MKETTYRVSDGVGGQESVLWHITYDYNVDDVDDDYHHHDYGDDDNYVHCRLIECLKNEAEIHRQQRHPNIAFMLGIVFEPNNYGILLEYVTYGALSTFLDNFTVESGNHVFSEFLTLYIIII